MASWGEFAHQRWKTWRSHNGRYRLGLQLAGTPEWCVYDRRESRILFRWPAHRSVKPAAVTDEGGLIHVAEEDFEGLSCLVECVSNEGILVWRRPICGLVTNVAVRGGTCVLRIGACPDSDGQQELCLSNDTGRTLSDLLVPDFSSGEAPPTAQDSDVSDDDVPPMRAQRRPSQAA